MDLETSLRTTYSVDTNGTVAEWNAAHDLTDLLFSRLMLTADTNQPIDSTTSRFYAESEWVYTCRLGISSHLRFVVDLMDREVIFAEYRPLGTLHWHSFNWEFTEDLEGWELSELLSDLSDYRDGALDDIERSTIHPTQFMDRLPEWAVDQRC